jgi:hypothetical protein
MVDLFLEAAGCGLEDDQDIVVTAYDVIAKRRATPERIAKAIPLSDTTEAELDQS